MEYDIMRQRPMPPSQDAQRTGGSGAFGASPPPAGTYQAGGVDPLAQARQSAFGALNSFYDRQYGGDPFAMQAQGQLQRGMSGETSPILAERALVADAAAGQYARERSELGRSAANAGLSLGGVPGGALAAARSRIDASQQRGQLGLTIGESQRQERYGREARDYIQEKAEADWRRTQTGVALLSRFEMTGQGPFGMGGGGGVSRNIPTGRATGGVNQLAAGQSGSYGGVTMIPGANMQPWRSGGPSAAGMRSNQGGTMGFDLSGYTSYPPGTTDRRYSDYDSLRDRREAGGDYTPQTMGYDPAGQSFIPPQTMGYDPYQPMPPPFQPPPAPYGSPRPTFQPPQGDYGSSSMEPYHNFGAPLPSWAPPQGDFGDYRATVPFYEDRDWPGPSGPAPAPVSDPYAGDAGARWFENNYGRSTPMPPDFLFDPSGPVDNYQRPDYGLMDYFSSWLGG